MSKRRPPLRKTHAPQKPARIAAKPSPASPPPSEPASPAIRIYCDGVFDLFHYGHARALQQAKSLFPHVHLLVGIPNDETTARFKGPTLMSAAERSESVRHCRYVDTVIEDAPWIITKDFLQKHRIDYIAHDATPYACGPIKDLYKPFKDSGHFVATQRTEGISTTDLITRVIKSYDTYLLRQIRRGVSRAELNISRLEEARALLLTRLAGLKTLQLEKARVQFQKRLSCEFQELKRAFKQWGAALRRGEWVGRVLEFLRDVTI